MTLREIIGRRRLTTLIARAIERETLPPTLLFAGPSGVGKWAVARATAQVVNCLDPVKSTGDAAPHLETDACGKCRSCDRIERVVHVEVIAVEPDDDGIVLAENLSEISGRGKMMMQSGNFGQVLRKNY